MGYIVLDDITFKVDVESFLKRNRIDSASDEFIRAQELIKEAEEIGRPKVIYKMASIEDRSESYVIVDGVKFTSMVMSVNFKGIHRVFPYVVTCGKELHDWSSTLEDIIEKYWADTIMEMALAEAFKAFRAHLEEKFKPGKTSIMNPGSLEDWPISQQKELMKVLEDKQESIGVELTDSFLMIPVKSTSGILFPSDSDFQSCQMCPRNNCPGRRAEYDENMFEEKYQISVP